MHRLYLSVGAILGAVAVALGAFGAHKLKELVPPEMVSTFETGVRYQFYHTFALILVAILYAQFPNAKMKTAGMFFIIGMFLFSGSLYLLTLFKATDTVGLSGIGIITPIGGLFLILGWIWIVLGLRTKSNLSV